MNERLKHIEKEIMALKNEGHDTQKLENSLKEIQNRSKKALSPWDKVMIARDKDRPNALEYINTIFDRFIELHGDRYYGDDGAIVGGLGMLSGTACTVIAIVKGKSTEENIKRNFGMVHPEGYRKALRLMKQAEKFNRPVLTLINTAGANATPESEEYGIGEAIASTLTTMSELTVPTLAIILGEGGSGGAIALALSDQVWMLENSIYAILSPEGFASILWKDSRLAADAAEMMRLTAPELLELGIIDRVIPEGEMSNEEIAAYLVPEIIEQIKVLKEQTVDDLVANRYRRFRKF